MVFSSKIYYSVLEQKKSFFFQYQFRYSSGLAKNVINIYVKSKQKFTNKLKKITVTACIQLMFSLRFYPEQWFGGCLRIGKEESVY